MSDRSALIDLRKKILQSQKLIDIYEWLIGSYVLDFYVDNHWDRLPLCWRSCFERVDIQELRALLTADSNTEQHTLWPLSILALRVLLQRLCLSRASHQQPDIEFGTEQQHSAFCNHKKLFDKSVKLKKRHEIEKFCNECWLTGQSADVKHLVDVGSGQGNLARSLNYGYGFMVCCIEQNEQLVEAARLKDEELSCRLKKQFKIESLHHPVHLSRKENLEIIDPCQFAQMIRDSFNVEKGTPFRFGLIGLHPCGDLAVVLLKLFLACPEAKFIKIVCCCYMKLSTKDDETESYGFPLSDFSNKHNLRLSYESREIACHAIEQYGHKLQTGYDELKVHAYRAAVEKIIVKLYPHLKHFGLKSTKVSNMCFQEYCDRATSGLQIELPQTETQSDDTRFNLSCWERVVKFYTLRLMFAPLIESLILYDRWLYLLEQGISSKIEAVFDPICSPRNHALTGWK
ncbi:methyltransferase-like protein 25B [Wyeomyia smithii]|uniref:methyltransferase-like protein 25B n=1 Tax=Wyeomyia smithii TaxID=174621 RepID=UPI00246805E2|nr:methyltransferase-like protein 25B [Wyeomyia smithii]XP_055536888.1 methyltransferase-like protein 25B [Wyeomyia smithii]